MSTSPSDSNPDRSFLSSTTSTLRHPVASVKEKIMSIRATTPYYSSATTRSASTAASAAKEGAGNAGRGILKSPAVLAALPFINGGLSGMVATAVVQPIDMVKVRIQLASSAGQSTSPFAIARSMAPSELYTGLSAGLLRQAVYTTARIGFFDTFMGKLQASAKENGTAVGFKERALAGLSAGGLAAMLGNPADLALIRMQSDGLKPAHLRANYTSVFNALGSITKSEGILALWTGSAPTVARAMALNFGQLAFFSEAKSQLSSMQTQGYHNLSANSQTLAASAAAGFFASFFSLPFDFVKTRMQKGGNVVDGRKVGMVGTALKVAREEGLLRFYRGFGTYYVRIAPHAMVTLLVADYLGWLTK